MKWFLGLLLVVALIGGALYGVGRFLLPNNLAVTRETTIERPRASVFAMVNDLQIVKEWSPYYARDPDAEYAFSGEGPGAGQTMRWTSNVKQIGSGRMSIVRSDDYREVDGILEIGDRAALNTSMALTPIAGGTKVSWGVTAECGDGWINVPCRYMNLVLRNMAQKDLDSGLARLKGLAEQLPNVDFEGLDVSEENAEPQHIIFVDATIAKDNPTLDDRVAAEHQGLAMLDQFVANNGSAVHRDGTVIHVFTSMDRAHGRISFRVGYPYDGPAPLTLVGVGVGDTPTGRVLKVTQVGRRSQLGLAYQRADAYLQAHRIGRRTDAPVWEVVTPADPAAIAAVPAPAPNADTAAPEPVEHTEIYFPIS